MRKHAKRVFAILKGESLCCECRKPIRKVTFNSYSIMTPDGRLHSICKDCYDRMPKGFFRTTLAPPYKGRGWHKIIESK
jgi:hypothetical protein